MEHVVARDFKSLNRRFKAGEPIAEKDIHPESKIDSGAALSSGLVKPVSQIEAAAGSA
jgi:hypothetical protein